MDLEEYLEVGVLSTGRRLFVLELMRLAAQEMGGHEDFMARIDEAAAHDEQTRELEHQWGGVRNGNFDTRVLKPLDRRLDHIISAVRDGAEVQRQGAAPHEPIHAAVDAFLEAALPEGVFAVTSLPYVDQLSETEKLIGMLRGPLADQVAELGLERQVSRLEEIVPEYRAGLYGTGEQAIEFAPVRAARRRGHRYLLELVAMVIGRHNRADDPVHQAARAQLLTPLAKQRDAARALRKRRAASGADPVTGELPDESPAELAAESAASVVSSG